VRQSETLINKNNQEFTNSDAEELDSVLKQLKEAKKVLRRDWPQLSARERSSQSRGVKQLEERKQELLDAIEMNGG